MKLAKIEPLEIVVPEAIQQAADQARERAMAAINRLEVKLDIDGKTETLRELIDADAGKQGGK